MRNPVIKLAIDTHRDTPVVSLRFKRDFGIIFRRSMQKLHMLPSIASVNVLFGKRNEVCTHVATNIGKNPQSKRLHDFFCKFEKNKK